MPDSPEPELSRTLSAKPPSRLWLLLRRLLVLGFFVLIVWLLVSRTQAIDWSEVWVALQALGTPVLLASLLLSLLSYALYGGYDLFARHYTRQSLPKSLTASIAAICYAFNLNMGAWLGGIGLRYRLYSRFGVERGTITRIVGLSLVTNWSGYCLLAGIAGSFGFVDLPDGGRIGDLGLRLIGFALLLGVTSYVALCGVSRRRSFSLRGTTVTLPSLRMAVAQIALSVANWMTMGLIVYLLLGAEIAYPTVLAVLLLSGIAGAVAHVPAGLGVVEAVFLALLGDAMADTELLAGLLAYRAVYYIAPLALAALGFAFVEALARRRPIRA
ncbi:MAG: lysylphosphatidylglycerol synthase domain-containing protein [Pseudomonadota bacterium]|nr:lysylphosphatidylglycerol synthase domain-containing protein [Pseudomonadota bacterium]